MAAGRRVKRSRRGGFDLRIPAAEREVLRALPGQLREVLTEGDPKEDPALRRLYPSAYPDDAAAAKEFDGFVRDDLTAERMTAIETMARTIEAEHVDEQELLGWLGAINDLRLVIGVRLDVTEESEPEDFADADAARTYGLYTYLTYLEEEIVEALTPLV